MKSGNKTETQMFIMPVKQCSISFSKTDKPRKRKEKNKKRKEKKRFQISKAEKKLFFN